MKRILPFLLVLTMLSVLLMPIGVFADDKAELLSGSQVCQKFDGSKNSVKEVYKATNGKNLPYRLYVPDDYDSSKKYPLVLFFHGAGERGTDNNAQISAGSVMQRLLTDTESKRFPCLILAPQCPGDSQWVLSDWGPGVYNHNTMQTPVSPYMAAAEELAKEGIEVGVIDMHTIKPLDEEILLEAAQIGPVVTAEEHSVIGGLGSAVAEVLSCKHPVKMAMVGQKDTFGESGKPDELKAKYGMTAADIVKAAKSLV